jgi:uncharacterized protein YgiM (DUF1202 family)
MRSFHEKRLFSTLLLAAGLVLAAQGLCRGQELSVLPRGVLEPGDGAVVTGDDVRVRSGPSLQHRILGSVNSGTPATVLERGKLQVIGDMKSHWYRVTLQPDGREGWVYGWFLGKPGGRASLPLASRDRATVTGDDVRLRSGPSLQHRILGFVNSGDAVTVLERGADPADVGGRKDYWYRVRADGVGMEGWMFGRFLEKRQVLVVATTEPGDGLPGADGPGTPSGRGKGVEPPGRGTDERGQREDSPEGSSPEGAALAGASFIDSPVRFREIAVIDHPRSFGVSGDLNRNGRTELVLVSEAGRGRYRLAGFEPADGEAGFRQVYTETLSGREVRGVSALTTPSGEAFLAVEGELYSTLYRYDERRGGFIRVRTFDSPLLAAGSLDGTGRYIVHLQQNRSPENDGTVTYTVTASKMEATGGKIRVLDSVSYTYPLPVKKLVVFDLDGDGGDEIVCEIGGKDRGGGVVVLRLEDQALSRIEHTGVATVQDRPFTRMWGVTLNGTPSLVLYTTDPAKGDDLGAEVGFLSATFEQERVRLRRFRPVNKLLDEANNERIVLHYPTDTEQVPFIVLDRRSAGGYSVKMPVSGEEPVQ